MRQREFQLVIVRCCTEYVVAVNFAVPRCGRCGETPTYYGETAWYLEVSA